MDFIPRALKIGFVCVTAVMTLVAAFPHFDCVCASGARKPFCLGFNLTGQSCGDISCCQQSDQRAEAAPSQSKCPRCSRRDGNANTAKHRSPDFKAPGCQKKFQDSEYAAARLGHDRSATGVTGDLAAPPASPSGESLFLPRACTFNLRLSHCKPPPTDLIVALQHFTI